MQRVQRGESAHGQASLLSKTMENVTGFAKYRCVICRQSQWTATTTFWRCNGCSHLYPCADGIPKLYLEDKLGSEDRELRDRFYDGFLGIHYGTVMPFLTLPARPLALSWPHWIIYGCLSALLLGIFAYVIHFIFVRHLHSVGIADVAVVLAAIASIAFLQRHRYLGYLFILAIPTRLSLLFKTFKPLESFADIHARLIGRYKDASRPVQVLDTSTGNCASLLKHGWTNINAVFTGVDLSETMIRQGVKATTSQKIPMDFVLADVAELPLQSETFDIVLNYGAINGMSDPGRALREMARVTKKGGLVLFLDEQLWDGATSIDRAYFSKVLSCHNTIHRCPVDLLPPELTNVEVHQVFQFYYICAATKA